MNANQPVELPTYEILSQLARDDPQAYETLRREVIEQFIDSVPEKYRRRLRGIQFQVDAVRRLSRSPLGSTIRIYKWMWESFHLLNDGCQEVVRVLEGRVDTNGSTTVTEYAPTRSAKILALRPLAVCKDDSSRIGLLTHSQDRS